MVLVHVPLSEDSAAPQCFVKNMGRRKLDAKALPVCRRLCPGCGGIRLWKTRRAPAGPGRGGAAFFPGGAPLAAAASVPRAAGRCRGRRLVAFSTSRPFWARPTGPWGRRRPARPASPAQPEPTRYGWKAGGAAGAGGAALRSRPLRRRHALGGRSGGHGHGTLRPGADRRGLPGRGAALPAGCRDVLDPQRPGGADGDVGTARLVRGAAALAPGAD